MLLKLLLIYFLEKEVMVDFILTFLILFTLTIFCSHVISICAEIKSSNKKTLLNGESTLNTSDEVQEIESTHGNG